MVDSAVPEDDNDRAEWDRAWRERPVRQLTSAVKIDVAPTGDSRWRDVLRVDIAMDPHLEAEMNTSISQCQYLISLTEPIFAGLDDFAPRVRAPAWDEDGRMAHRTSRRERGFCS